jgi:iron complex transport system substrate-binding protein
MNQHRVVLILLAAIAMLAMPGCRRSTPPSATPASGDAPTFRIVCVSPALTDILIDLGLESNIVGRDIWDQQLDPSVPRVGDLFELDYEALLALEPTDVVLQVQASNVPPFLNEISREQGFRVVALHINTLTDVVDAVHELNDALSFTGVPARRTDARRRAAEIEAELNDQLKPLPVEVRQHLGSILILHHVEPPAAFGPGSYLVQVLERFGAAGSLTNGGPWQELDLETVVHLDPWAIVLINPGADEKVDRESLPGALGTLNLSAAKHDRIGTLTHREALLPGTCIGAVALELRTILTGFADAANDDGGRDQ